MDANSFNFLQVSPELYGDNYPRFFTYWTVSFGSFKQTIKFVVN